MCQGRSAWQTVFCQEIPVRRKKESNILKLFRIFFGVKIQIPKFYRLSYIFPLFYSGAKIMCQSPTVKIKETKVGNLIHHTFASNQKRVKVCRQSRWKIFFCFRFFYFLLNKKTNLQRPINAFACLHTCSSRIRWSMTPQQKVWEKQGEQSSELLGQEEILPSASFKPTTHAQNKIDWALLSFSLVTCMHM